MPALPQQRVGSSSSRTSTPLFFNRAKSGPRLAAHALHVGEVAGLVIVRARDLERSALRWSRPGDLPA